MTALLAEEVSLQVSDAQVAQFREDGFLVVENLFDADEVELLRKIAKSDREKRDRLSDRTDTEGRTTKLWLTSEAREDKPGHPSYQYPERWPDSRIREIGQRQLAELQTD